jgi:hypothetical protein
LNYKKPCNVEDKQETAFRICPRCGKKWVEEREWISDTILNSTEKRAFGAIKVDVREHKCGGMMLSSGLSDQGV